MNRIRSIAILIPALLIALHSPQCLELKNGNIKLVLHERLGRFSLYTRSERRGEEYIPLFVAQDPRTSGITLVVDGELVKLGDSSKYREEVERTGNGARFIWSSKMLQVSETFIFVASGCSEVVDGIKITLILKNLTGSELESGLRFCLDTYLGEAGGVHFKTDRHSEIESELEITREKMVDYWLSPSDPEAGVLLQCVTSGGDVTPADRIVFANWKRLQDASWTYKTYKGRSFNLMPYSINDSAVCHYYDPVPIGGGSERKISLILGNFSPGGFQRAGPERLPGLDSLLKEAAEAPAPEEEETYPAKSDLEVLNKLLAEISEKLSSREEISEEELRIMREILADLKSRISRYKEGK